MTVEDAACSQCNGGGRHLTADCSSQQNKARQEKMRYHFRKAVGEEEGAPEPGLEPDNEEKTDTK